MSRNAVIKGAGYVLVHGPDFVIHNGTTQTTEKIVNPSSEYLALLPKHIRSYEDTVVYPPNQVYIGNLVPEELLNYETPWYDKKVETGGRYGKFGEIMPQDEFLGLVQICDVFDLVFLKKEFVASIREKLQAHPLVDETLLNRLKEGVEEDLIIKQVESGLVEPLYNKGELVGYVKRGHDIDPSLTAHILLENIVYKATGVLSLLHLIKNSGIDKGEIDYVIDCSEEACGDMNQRGGGNFAKAEAEIAGLYNATGSDTRGFCAAPAHALILGASLVKSGTYKNVVVFAGGTTAKLGMNGKDHVKKGLPILEDVMGGFAVLISENDGISPEINTDIVGWHKVGTGSSPQAVISSLVTEPLEKVGLKITDIGKYAAEMQNPDVTKPAGAGDVPEANYKMIAALGVRQGALERADIPGFVKNHGMPGWAPTQGHIPSGVPYLGFARADIMSGKIERAMIIGKGSLFLGRMTNLFDGVSVVIQKNIGNKGEDTKQKSINQIETPVIGIAAEGSELGMDNIYEAAALAERKGYKAVIIEGEDSHKKMEEMLESGEIQGAVTMHYPFPIGVSTVGRVVTPGKGKDLFLATTTGTSSTDRVEGMIRNAIYGIIAAKAAGIKEPTVGIANVDGARQAEMALITLRERGYDIKFAQSQRGDGGIVMRGNDLLTASSDIMVMDPLTGNLMMKMFAAYTTGGSYESTGYGYGPGIGEGYDKLIMIVSRASGAPVIAGAVEYASNLVANDWKKIAREEFAKAHKAGLKDILETAKCRSRAGDGALPKAPEAVDEVTAPPKEIVTAEIQGIEVMDIEDAAICLWKEGIYAETGMGCTGPVVLVNESNEGKSREVLSAAGFII